MTDIDSWLNFCEARNLMAKDEKPDTDNECLCARLLEYEQTKRSKG